MPNIPLKLTPLKVVIKPTEGFVFISSTKNSKLSFCSVSVTLKTVSKVIKWHVEDINGNRTT